jgi:DNA-binding NtrC family response regulator
MSPAHLPATTQTLGAAFGPLLLVEDDAVLRQMLSWELADLGYEIGTAAGCAEARQLADEHAFRCALIDVRLPDGDGRDLSARLTERVPGLRVVLMSGDPRVQSAPPPTSGVLALIAKPLEIDVAHRLFSAAAGLPSARMRSAAATAPTADARHCPAPARAGGR